MSLTVSSLLSRNNIQHHHYLYLSLSLRPGGPGSILYDDSKEDN